MYQIELNAPLVVSTNHLATEPCASQRCAKEALCAEERFQDHVQETTDRRSAERRDSCRSSQQLQDREHRLRSEQ